MNNWSEKTFKNSHQLLHEAIIEFSNQSYEKASLNHILQNANMSKGVFYHHFHTKENLYLYCVGYYLNQRKAFLINRLRPEDLEGDVFHFIKKSITLSIDFAATEPWVRPFSEQLIKERGNDIYQKVLSHYTIDNDAFLSGLLQKAIDRGQFKDEFSLPFIRNLIVHILSHVNDILDTQDIDDYIKKIDALLHFMQYGLKK